MKPRLRPVPKSAPDVKEVVERFYDEVARDTGELAQEIVERLGRGERREPPVQPRSSGKNTGGA